MALPAPFTRIANFLKAKMMVCLLHTLNHYNMLSTQYILRDICRMSGELADNLSFCTCVLCFKKDGASDIS